MKFIIATLIAFSPSLYAQTDCSKALDDVKLMCEGAQRACDDVKECLVRRDTCVQGVPKNENDCSSLNTCMQDYKSEFPDSTRCDYTWAIPSSGEGFCRVKKHFLFFEEACPGRTHGLLNAFAYGLNSTVDSKFNCESVVKKRSEKVESCQDRISKAKSLCGTLPEYVSALENVSCAEAKNFARYRNREFALQSSDSVRINDSRRGGSNTGSPSSSSSSSSPTPLR